MARRRLLTPEQWASLLALPTTDREMVRHYTFGQDDLAVLAAKRAPYRRLGAALVLCYLRYPGRVLEADELPPTSMLSFVAAQVSANPDEFSGYQRRAENRRQDLVAMIARTGQKPFDRKMFREISGWLVSIAQVNRDPLALARVLIDELRRRGVLLPSAGVLELILHQARGRAERLLHKIVGDAIGTDGQITLGALLEPHEETSIALLAWLHRAPQSPAPRNLVAVIERLETLRRLGIDRRLRDHVPEAAFDRLAAEGGRMTVQHIRDLATSRRIAVLAATAIRLEAALTNAALLMFEKLIGSLGRRAECVSAWNKDPVGGVIGM